MTPLSQLGVGELLVQLASRGIRLSPRGEKLCVQANKQDDLTADVLGAVKRRKRELLAVLRRREGEPADRVLAQGTMADGGCWALYDPGDGSTPVRIVFAADSAERAR